MALVFVMVFVIAMAALAVSSIFMSSGSTMLARSYDRERDLRFAAEVALAIGKSKVNQNPNLLILPAGVNFAQIMTNEPLVGADFQPIPGVVGNVYIGLTGSSSGQNGRFASIVAQAVDPVTNTSFIRRLEMTQESFAKYAYWSNSETNSSGATIYFNNGDQFWGPVWSNDRISIGSGGATFNSDVGTASVIDGMVYGTFAVPPLQNQKPIALPSTSVLSQLQSYAALGGDTLQTAEGASNNEKIVRDRIEFIALDTDSPADGDSTGTDEGFYRRYQGYNITGSDSYVRGDWPGTVDSYGYPTSVPKPANVNFCGDWHWTTLENGQPRLAFYPASVHGQTWFKSQLTTAMNALPISYVAPYTSVSTYVSAEAGLTTEQILQHPNARCYPAGDPHLVAVDRGSTYPTSRIQRGGEDTTFTPKGNYGQWIAPVTPPPAAILALRPKDGAYLHPLGHSFNPNGKGVIYASGNVGISGVVNGLVTLYTPGSIVILDDVRYANDPVLGVCHDILGLISGNDVVVADNAINSPVGLDLQSADNYGYTSLDDSPGVFLHAVSMSLGSSFRVENPSLGPRTGQTCGTVSNGRGCLDLSGGLIQVSRGYVGWSWGTGFAKRYTYDRCAVRNPPPYFPTTGRFIDNRYLELDPVGFNPDAYFRSLIPGAP